MGDRTRFVALLERIQNASRLSGGETGSGPGWSRLGSEYRDPLRVVVAFPEAYEIGISNQAIQILYHLARETAGVGVERCYLPWVEAISLMRAEGLICDTETWSPSRCDLASLSMSSTTPTCWSCSTWPGFPCAHRSPLSPGDGRGQKPSNFLPMEPFLDAVWWDGRKFSGD